MSDDNELKPEILKKLFLKILIIEKDFLKTRNTTHDKAADIIKTTIAKMLEEEGETENVN